MRIWNYQTNNLIKLIKFHDFIESCNFKDESKLLYIGTSFKLYQFYVSNKFKKLSKMNINFVRNIYFISNTLILTSSYDKIIKTDFNKKK